MRQLAMLAALAAVLLTSCAATLNVRGIAPSADNDGTCGAPKLTPRKAAQPVWIVLEAVGAVTVRDSVRVTSGAAWSFSIPVPADTYACRVHAADEGGVSCDTTFTRIVRSTPWKPSVL